MFSRLHCFDFIVLFVMKHPHICGSSLAFMAIAFCWFTGLGYWPSLFTHAESEHFDLFPGNDLIVDIQDGSFERLTDNINRGVITLVLFYASWSADSALAAAELSQVSLHLNDTLGDQITFIGINCWTGTCKTALAANSFPLLVGYHGGYDAVAYTDEMKGWRMALFVENLLRPAVYVGSLDDWNFLKMQNRAVVVGYFDVNSVKQHTFFDVCLSMVNRADHPICGIVTNDKMMKAVGLTDRKDVILKIPLHSQLLHFEQEDVELNSSNLLSWIDKNFAQEVLELSPNGTHLAAYKSHLMTGPALILFHSKQDKFKQFTTAALAMFRKMAVTYRNCSCSNSQKKQPMAVDSAQQTLRPSAERSAAKKVSCSLHDSLGFCKTMVYSHKAIVCDVCQYIGRTGICIDFITSSTLQKIQQAFEPRLHECHCMAPLSYLGSHITGVCCMSAGIKIAQGALFGFLKSFLPLGNINLGNADEVALGMKDEKNGDSFSSIDQPEDSVVMDLTHEEKCHRVVPIKALEFGFNGLGCHTNRTVRFFTMDADKYAGIVNQLGVTPHHMTSLALIIVDVKDETQYALDDAIPLDEDNIKQFVLNFTVGSLTRMLRSMPAAKTACNDDAICIVEVTSNTFRDVVFRQNQDVLLLYFSPSCGFCTSLRSSYFQVADVTKNVSTLVVARINGDENDLPWPFTVRTYPTIVLFPAYGKHRSVTFPVTEELSPYNILSFSQMHSAFQTKHKLQQLMTSHSDIYRQL